MRLNLSCTVLYPHSNWLGLCVAAFVTVWSEQPVPPLPLHLAINLSNQCNLSLRHKESCHISTGM